jgi:hypothetical protein
MGAGANAELRQEAGGCLKYIDGWVFLRFMTKKK